MQECASAGMRRVLQAACQAARETRVAWARGRADPGGKVAGVPEESGQVDARRVRARGARCGDSARGFGRGRCVDGRRASRCWVRWRKRAGCSGTCSGGPAGRRRLRGWGWRCRRCARRCARGFCIGGCAPCRDGVCRLSDGGGCCRAAPPRRKGPRSRPRCCRAARGCVTESPRVRGGRWSGVLRGRSPRSTAQGPRQIPGSIWRCHVVRGDRCGAAGRGRRAPGNTSWTAAAAAEDHGVAAVRGRPRHRDGFGRRPLSSARRPLQAP